VQEAILDILTIKSLQVVFHS